MNLSEIKRYVSLGEGQHVEFKRRLPRPERIAKEVIAFANARGGHVFLGVDDDGSVVGLKDVFEEEFALVQAIEQHIEPTVEIHLSRIPLTHRREVLAVDVPASSSKPHFLVAIANGREGQPERRTAFVRVGASSVEASREAIRLMRHERNPRDVRFEFGEKERKLMAYLDRHERITVAAFARLAGIPMRRASQTLVLLAKAQVLQFHPRKDEDHFTMAYGSDG